MSVNPPFDKLATLAFNGKHSDQVIPGNQQAREQAKSAKPAPVLTVSLQPIPQPDPYGFIATIPPLQNVAIIDKNRFSKFVGSRNLDKYKDLENWVDWFQSRGIPARIGETGSGFAVYREGRITDQDHEKHDNH